MRHRKTLLVAIGIALLAGLTLANDKIDLSAIGRIKAEGFGNSKVMEIASDLTDLHGPRLTGSPTMKAANEYVREQLEKWGLSNAHLEAWGPFGRGWSLERFSAHMIEPQVMPIIGYPKSWTPGTNGVITGPVVLAEIQTEADFEKYRGKLRGTFVLTQTPRDVNAWFAAAAERHSEDQLRELSMMPVPGARPAGARRGGPSNREFQNKLNEFWLSEGVAAVLDQGFRGDGGTLFVGSGGQRQVDARPVPSQVVIAVEHYGRIFRLLEKKVPVKLEMDIRARFHDADTMAYNTIAEIPGTDKKDEIVMLGAHLDSHHSATGATDNAAGSAVVMEAVRILKAAGLTPRRTIRVALWTGEEQGLLGSRAYVSEHFASRPQPPDGQESSRRPAGANRGPLTLKPEHAKLAGYFNLDNGTGKVRGIYLQANEEVRPIFEAWMVPFRDLGATTVSIRTTGGTDHLSFDGVGLPGFQFVQDEIEYDTRTHHTNMDTYERLQRGDLMQAAVIVASFVYQTAMRDEKLPRKPLPR